MEEKANPKTNNVFTEKAHQMGIFKNFFINLGNSLLKLLLWLFDLILSMFTSLWHFIKLFGLGIVGAFKKFYLFIKRKCHQFKYNDWSGRLSFIIFGTSSFKHKQIVNGIGYVLFEIAYITMFIFNGIGSIKMLKTLGTKTPGPDPDCMDDFCDWVNGDNSILLLIFGLVWILSIIVFIYIWNRSINAGYNNFRIDNFVKFDDLTKKSMDFSKKLDEEATKALNSGVSKTKFKEEKILEINDFIQVFSNKYEHDYTKYLLVETINHSYQENKKLNKLTSKFKKNEEKTALKIKSINEKLDKNIILLESKKVLVSDNEEAIDKLNLKIESLKGNAQSKIRNLSRKGEVLERKIYEFKKTYAFFGLLQNVRNNKLYGKFNDYFNVVGRLNSDITFYANYDEFKYCYVKNLAKNEEANTSNKHALEELEKTKVQKINDIHKKYDDFRAKRLEIENKTELAKKEYEATLKAIKSLPQNEKEHAQLEAKALLVQKSSEYFRELHYLPSKKAIVALEKEEIKEVNNAYLRDKKYLKTNFTPEGYATEQTINRMIVDYKIEYAVAREYFKKLFKKNKEFLSDAEVKEKLSETKEELKKYENDHQDKFVGRPRSFKESFDGLFNENFHITILALPVLGIAFMTVIPLLFSILVAFTNYSVGHIPPTQLFTWTGFDNFKNLFFPDANSIYTVLPEALMRTLGWTLIWAIIATFSNYILGIIVALLINKDGIKLKKLWRTVFILTIAIPQFISLLSIGTLLKDTGAIGSLVFQLTGNRLGFGTDSSANGVLFAKIIIILVNIWVGIPYTILSTTGILLNIPKDLYESARVDGAGTFTQFTKITMPYILFVTGPYLITQFVGNINNFNVIYFLTGGGPAIAGSALLGLGQTDLLITFLYKIITSTNNPQFGIASSVGIFIFVVCSFISIVMYNKSGAIKEEDQFQ